MAGKDAVVRIPLNVKKDSILYISPVLSPPPGIRN